MDMECNVIVDTETLTLCRLCTDQKGKYHIGPNMIEQIKDCFNIHINNFDGLSQIICNKCQIIVGEFHQAKKNYRQKQDALLERRKQLLLKESEETEDITSTSIIRICSPPPPQPPPPQPPSPKSSPIALTPDAIIDVDQVPSVSSSERATSPTSNAQTHPTCPENVPTPPKTVPTPPKTVPILFQTVPITCQPTPIVPKIVRIANSPKKEEPKSPENQYSYKFTCIFCAKGYMNKGQLKRHRLNFHPNLSRVTCALTTPCCIRMEKINLLKGAGQARERQPWVQLRPGEVTKYSPTEPYHISSRFPVTSNVANVELSSSEDENGEPLAKMAKMTSIIGEKQTAEAHIEIDSDTNNVPAYAVSDSDSRGSFDKASSVAAEETPDVAIVELAQETSLLREVGSIQEDKGVQVAEAKPKPWMALHDKEFVNIIQSCWRLSQKKKVLTAPVAKPWLIDTIKDNMAVEVVFVCSKITKVSMIKSIDMEPNKDPLTALPSYVLRKRGDTANGHLRLKRVPVTLPRPDALPPPPPPPAPNPPDYSVVKQNNKSQSKSNSLVKIFPGQCKPFIPSANKAHDVLRSFLESEPKPFATRPSTVPSQVATFASPPAAKPWSKPRLVSPVATIPVPVTQISDATANTATISIPPTSVTPPDPVNIIPISNTEFFSPHEECEDLTPIIISTVSLAPSAESAARPQLKCRPTSALLASPLPPMNPVLPLLQLDPSLPPGEMASLFSAPVHNAAPNISVPLLSGNLFFNNGVFTTNGMSPFDQFTNRLRDNNVFIVKQDIPNEAVDELVRFILTIREKSVAHNQYNTCHEFLVKVSGYLQNRILISTQDTQSNQVDVVFWSNDFQQELIKSLRKPTFLDTMLTASQVARPDVTSCVARFIFTCRDILGDT